MHDLSAMQARTDRRRGGIVKVRLKSEKTKVYQAPPAQVVVKRALWAIRCDSCGLIFSGGDTPRHQFSGKTDVGMVEAHVCSFVCADKLLNGGWCKELIHWATVSVFAGSPTSVEDQLVSEWENKPYCRNSSCSGSCSGSYMFDGACSYCGEEQG